MNNDPALIAVMIASMAVAGCSGPSDRPTADVPVSIEAPSADDVPRPPIKSATRDGIVGQWRVTAINDRATPGGSTYFINFDGDRVSAQFGCNGMGGTFRLNGDHLSTSDLVQSLIGCPEPAATFEDQGRTVLGSNMRVEANGDGVTRLVSEAGSIDIERID